MKIFLFICGCIAICSAIPSIIDEWASFKARNGKSYKDPLEEHYRLGVYMSNKRMIEAHNAKYKAGLVSFQLQMNHLGDKLPEEITAQLNGFNRSGVVEKRRASGFRFEMPVSSEALPTAVDWRQKGAVTPVKNQGQCGSCWAFSSTGSLEGQLFKKGGKLVSLSEQNLVDCAGDYGNEGCEGGLMDQAFDYIQHNGGIDSEDSYPYEGTKNECRFKKASIAGSVQGFVDIPEGDETALLQAVATVGPVSVAINAGLHSFSFYSKGTFNDAGCDASLNHGVLVVGYGTENGSDYWLVKNSWGTAWGEQGYIKMARNKGNLCGIASMASYPLV